jgi:hypothetical protein
MGFPACPRDLITVTASLARAKSLGAVPTLERKYHWQSSSQTVQKSVDRLALAARGPSRGIGPGGNAAW